MNVREVDPWDQRWAVNWPDYRVYFYDSNGSTFEYELGGADVVEVLQWAEAQEKMRAFVVYACVRRDGLGLVRLTGEDPNDPRPEAK